MYCDFVLMKKSDGILNFAKELGYSKVYFKEDIEKFKIVNGGSLDVNRSAVENKNVDILLNPHLVSGRDGFSFRNSGLNQILCKLAAENDVAVGVSLNSLNGGVSIGRVVQNICLCRKYKVRMLFFSFASDRTEMRGVVDILSLLSVLGLSGCEGKMALSGLEK